MKQIISILSFLSLASCKLPFPKVPVMWADLKHNACVEYEIIDQENFKVALKKEHPLSVCQDMIGFKKADFKKVQNWARDTQATCQ